ncbi:hypothetical protein RchiOBHm_Chr2g0113271 [Rosa chinensis]|uniref:Uncharacterized protein n=1 Tax=Rosa chinensis TaxID=74649 RepID=A0A2P6RQE3_ROSCH|nr:hypothetical protein RchiOBHm_Chr2g0113271 [Rosa chinensis]
MKSEEEMFMASLICNLEVDCGKLLVCKSDLDCIKTLHFDTQRSTLVLENLTVGPKNLH